MSKIGNTDDVIFTCMFQYFTVVAGGGEVKKSPPHPSVEDDWNAMTLSVPYDFGTPRPDSVTCKALLATSAIVQAIGDGRIASVEELPVQGDEKAKYVITIKKQSPPSAQTDGSV